MILKTIVIKSQVELFYSVPQPLTYKRSFNLTKVNDIFQSMGHNCVTVD